MTDVTRGAALVVRRTAPENLVDPRSSELFEALDRTDEASLIDPQFGTKFGEGSRLRQIGSLMKDPTAQQPGLTTQTIDRSGYQPI
jgi:hypothetical protein